MLLDRILGANLREYPAGSDFDIAMERVADEIRAEGGTPYIIPGGASNKVGALGYVNCVVELITQIDEQGLVIDHLVTATGSAGTQAGLAVGLKALESQIPLLGIGVSAPRDEQEEKVYTLACETAQFIGMPGIVERSDVLANCNYIGDGYGIPTDAMNEAILMLARLEGLLFDSRIQRQGPRRVDRLDSQWVFRRREKHHLLAYGRIGCIVCVLGSVGH